MKTSVGSREIALAQLGGLIAAGWFVWTSSPRTRLFGSLMEALSFSARAWAASAIVTFYILLIVSSDDPKSIPRDALRRSSVGIWFAPAMILLSIFSPLALGASIVLAM